MKQNPRDAAKPPRGLNRNILECKFIIFYFPDVDHGVLIETYWNVNYTDGVRIGLDIIVLIETYWNVNALKKLVNDDTPFVLIETYWNVNNNVLTIVSKHRPES